jgi:hypothetical protein
MLGTQVLRAAIHQSRQELVACAHLRGSHAQGVGRSAAGEKRSDSGKLPENSTQMFNGKIIGHGKFMR